MYPLPGVGLYVTPPPPPPPTLLPLVTSAFFYVKVIEIVCMKE